MPDENDLLVTTYQIDFVAILQALYEYFAGEEGDFAEFLASLASWWQLYSIIAFALSAVLLYFTIYAMIRFAQMSDAEGEIIRAEEKKWKELFGSAHESNRWKEVKEHISSESPVSWRLAIIEADIMLEEMLEGLGYSGSTIGDMLKQANPNSFRTIDDAWKAHKVRNDIAHRGSDFILTKKVAQETINQYERVFREFSFI